MLLPVRYVCFDITRAHPFSHLVCVKNTATVKPVPPRWHGEGEGEGEMNLDASYRRTDPGFELFAS